MKNQSTDKNYIISNQVYKFKTTFKQSTHFVKKPYLLDTCSKTSEVTIASYNSVFNSACSSIDSLKYL